MHAKQRYCYTTLNIQHKNKCRCVIVKLSVPTKIDNLMKYCKSATYQQNCFCNSIFWADIYTSESIVSDTCTRPSIRYMYATQYHIRVRDLVLYTCTRPSIICTCMRPCIICTCTRPSIRYVYATLYQIRVRILISRNMQSKAF